VTPEDVVEHNIGDYKNAITVTDAASMSHPSLVLCNDQEIYSGLCNGQHFSKDLKRNQ
jgi:hypothetical protein